MDLREPEFNLAPDELAIRFGTERGIDVDKLASFLQRIATVARRAGADLKVVAIREGSLVVKFRAVARAAGKEFKKTPLAATASAGAIGVIAVAIAQAMVPSYGKVTPLAKAGAELVDEQQVQTIEVITVNQTIIVMDEERAAQVHALERHREAARKVTRVIGHFKDFDAPGIPRLIDQAKEGSLFGEVFTVDGTLHFRPDGFRYLVPIDASTSDAYGTLHSGRRYRVAGQIVTQGGLPDRIVISSAAQR